MARLTAKRVKRLPTDDDSTIMPGGELWVVTLKSLEVGVFISPPALSSMRGDPGEHACARVEQELADRPPDIAEVDWLQQRVSEGPLTLT